MHPALLKLIALQFRGTLRQMLFGGSARGRIVVFFLGAMLFVAWLGSAVLTVRARTQPQRVRDVMPIALLAICIVTSITSAGDKAIAFTPGEIDQLFPGPFSRRELLGFKLLKSGLNAILTASVLSIVMLRHARWWPASFVGVFLALLFVQWFSIALLLSGQAIGTAAYSKLRKLIIGGAVIALLIGGRTWMNVGVGGGEAALMQFRASPIGRTILSPLQPFGFAMTSTRLLELLCWAGLAAVLNVGLLMIVFLLDSYYIETAFIASERRYAKIRRVRAGSLLSVGVGKTSTWHLPQLPWAGGAGPIAWRQLTSAVRSSRGLLLLLAIVAIGAAPVLSMAGHGKQVADMLLGAMGWLTFLCSSMFIFDFRGDVDHIENLKTLPLRPWAVVVGQLLVPVVMLTALHTILLAIAAVWIPDRRNILIPALAVALPFNVLLFIAENLVFLLFPSRPAAVSPGDFQAMGRKFLFVMLKILILSFLCGVSFFFAMLVWIFTSKNVAAGTIVAWLILATEAIALIPLMAWAYRRFDPSVHTPA